MLFVFIAGQYSRRVRRCTEPTFSGYSVIKFLKAIHLRLDFSVIGRRPIEINPRSNPVKASARGNRTCNLCIHRSGRRCNSRLHCSKFPDDAGDNFLTTIWKSSGGRSRREVDSEVRCAFVFAMMSIWWAGRGSMRRFDVGQK